MSTQTTVASAGLVLVVDTPSIRHTVEATARRRTRRAPLHLLALTGGDEPTGRTAALLTEAHGWVSTARSGRNHEGSVARAGRTVEKSWPTAADVVEVVTAYTDQHGVERVVVPADIERVFRGVTATDLVAALSAAGVADRVVGPRDRTVFHRPLAVAGDAVSTGVLFVLSLAFYLLLAGSVDAFEAVTGVATAAVVAATFGRVTFTTPLDVVRSTARAGRWCLYVPYLLWEVAKANVAIAAIVLHPRLPIDPKLVSYPTSIDGELALTTFANSVTLTPGTLTVDVDTEAGTLLVHTLTAGTRADLIGGSLERAVRFVFDDRQGGRRPDRQSPAAEVSDD